MVSYIALSFISSIEPSTKLFITYSMALVGSLAGAFLIKNPKRFIGDIILDSVGFIARLF